MAKFFLAAWLIVALTYLPVAEAETPTPDSDQSTRLTDYLHAHRLPLVGAQVLNSQSGRSVMLYGYTATDFGKSDAEAKARRFLQDNSIVVSNHIRVRPELLSMKSPAGSSSSAATGAEAPPPDVSAYQNHQNDAQQAYINQQAQQYMNQGSGGAGLATALIPLLGMGLAIGLGGSGSGFGMGISPGGIGGGYGGGYGTYGSPYGGNPYGYPYGPNPYGGPPSPYP